ncbi:class I SAM-dependent methyltransferase [Streptomyces sp. Ru62]|uniref:class I SAM-dependent methyltransferase n=1 Tax=Streptomyces sp. Ru62 TaxID=2080745 RepID=UPI0021565C47|nr:class I SAM-dependent methyltransferase [Streptomyces sp. Ru62]
MRTFDDAVRAFLREHPRGDNGRAHWLCVELPQTARARRALLPDEERRRTTAQSAPDLSWRDEVDPAQRVLVTAQGLLMYLRPAEVRRLIAGCAEAFPGGALVFDAVPRWFGERTRRGRMKTAQGHVAPPMPWRPDAGELPKIRTAHPAVTEVRELPLPRGRGAYFGVVWPVLRRLPGARNIPPAMTVLARFGPTARIARRALSVERPLRTVKRRGRR